MLSLPEKRLKRISKKNMFQKKEHSCKRRIQCAESEKGFLLICKSF